MGKNLQELIDHGMTFSEVELPIGEFEGPFYVRKPCTLWGNATTLWSRRGPALIIESNGVTIRNLRAEVLEAAPGEEDYLSIVTKQRDTVFDHVEIIGRVQGVAGEEQSWKLPQLLQLGEFAADGSQFMLEVEVPVETDVYTSITALTITPEHLQPGRNQLVLTLDACKPGTFFYGELAFVSQFTQKAYLSGLASENVATQAGAVVIYTPEQGSVKGNILHQELLHSRSLAARPVEIPAAEVLPLHGQKATAPLAVLVPPGVDTKLLRRGERVAVPMQLLDELQLVLTYTERNEQLDIDPYVYLLDGQNRAQRDEDMIFFGNPQSLCGGVQFQEEGAKKIIRLSLHKVAEVVERVSLSYAIYGERPDHNFSKLQESAVQLLDGQGKEYLRLPLTDLSVERTLVAIEFYRHKGQWKLNAIGSGYRDGLKRLCESYGLEIADA